MLQRRIVTSQVSLLRGLSFCISSFFRYLHSPPFRDKFSRPSQITMASESWPVCCVQAKNNCHRAHFEMYLAHLIIPHDRYLLKINDESSHVRLTWQTETFHRLYKGIIAVKCCSWFAVRRCGFLAMFGVPSGWLWTCGCARPPSWTCAPSLWTATWQWRVQ